MGMLDISSFSNNTFYNTMPSFNIMNVEKQTVSDSVVKAQPVILKTVSFTSNKSNQVNDKPEQSDHLRELLKKLNEREKSDNPYIGTSNYKENGMFKTEETSSDEKEEDLIKIPYVYNYKDVANKIQRAKTSLSAGQAVISARKKVIEVKRKIASGAGDADDLQVALTHAKRMEMVARSKKRHLELEEMAELTRKRDERFEEQEDRIDDIRNAVISYEEEKIKEQEDAIFDEREAMIEEAVKEYEENQSYASEQMMAEFNEMVAEFGEEELKALEEAMEVFDELEVIDPHMSEEDLEKLKRKHRASEDKAITKANMDYLKDIFKHHQMKIEGGGAAKAPSVLPSFASVTPAAIPVSIPTVDVPSINIQV